MAAGGTQEGGGASPYSSLFDEGARARLLAQIAGALGGAGDAEGVLQLVLAELRPDLLAVNAEAYIPQRTEARRVMRLATVSMFIDIEDDGGACDYLSETLRELGLGFLFDWSHSRAAVARGDEATVAVEVDTERYEEGDFAGWPQVAELEGGHRAGEGARR